MAIVRYDPYDVFKRLSDQLESVIGGQAPVLGDEESSIATSAWRPAVDIKEEADRFVISADVPGVDPEKIDVTMDNGMLTIKGERSEEKETEKEGYRRIERMRGSFYRRFSMPDSADSHKISARSANGVLEITVPKREVVRPRKIAVDRK